MLGTRTSGVCHKAKFFKIWAFWAGARHQHLVVPGKEDKWNGQTGLFLLLKTVFASIFLRNLR